MPGPIAAHFAEGERLLETTFEKCLRSRSIDVARFDVFRRLLLHRIAAEERILFPALISKLGHPPLFREAIRKDHAGLAALCVPLPDRVWSEMLGSQLEQHAGVEDGLYEMSDEVLHQEAHGVVALLRALPPLKVAPFHAGRWGRELMTDVLTATGLGMTAPVPK